MDDVKIGKYVKARLPTNSKGRAWLVGRVAEIKRDGDCIVLDSGWNINLDHYDELIYCGDTPCPNDVM